MINFFFFLFLIIFMTINYKIFKKNYLSDNLSNPLFLFGLFFFIIHMLLPYLQWINGEFRYKSNYDIGVYIYSIFYIFLAYLLCFISFQMGFKSKENKSRLNLDTRNVSFNLSKKLITIFFRITVVVFFIGLYFAYQVYSLISILGQEDYLRDRIGLGVGSGINMLLPHWIYTSSLIFYFLYSLTKVTHKLQSRYSFIFFLISFSATTIYYITNSNRNSIFILLLNILIIHFVFQKIKVKRLSLKKFMFLIFAGIIAITLFYEIGKARYGTFYKGDDEYTLLDNLNGAFGNHENIVWMQESNYSDYFYGETYLAGFTNFIPRSFWPDKPLGAGPRMKNIIYPGSYVVGKDGNSSLTTGLFNELLMNFGVIGMLIGSVFFGFLLKYIYIKIKLSNSMINILILQYTLIVFTSQFVYAEFLGFFSRYIITIIPFLIIKFFYYRKSLKK